MSASRVLLSSVSHPLPLTPFRSFLPVIIFVKVLRVEPSQRKRPVFHIHAAAVLPWPNGPTEHWRVASETRETPFISFS